MFSSHLNSDVKNGANFYYSSCIKLAAQETWDSNKIVENIGKAIPRKANTVKSVERKIMKIISVPGYLTEPIRKSTQKVPHMPCGRGKYAGV